MKVRIKEIMQQKGITSVALSEMMGISKATVSNLINNKTMPSIDTLGKIAEALDVPNWQLFASEEEVFGDSKNSITCPKCGARFKLEEN